MPTVIFQKIKSKINPIRKTAFLSAFIFGIIAHLYRMTNWLPNWDSLVFRKDSQHMEALGRWFLSCASAISSDYELPWINGLLAIIYISAAAVLVCETLCIKSRTGALLTGAVTVTFPAVTSTLAYCYVADAYALSFLLSCAAAYLLVKRKTSGAVAATVLLTLSMGIYQAYITCAIAILTASLISGLAFCGEKAAVSAKRALKYIICGVAALAFYCLINFAVSDILGVNASEYQGIAETFSFKEISFIPAFLSSVYSFYKFFISFPNGFNFYSAVNIIGLAVIAAGYIRAIIKNTRAAALPLIILYIISIPAGCSALYFANSGIDYHTLMKMSYFSAYIYLIMLGEHSVFKKRIFEVIKAWSVILLCAATVFCNILTANTAYHKLAVSYEKSYGILIRISDRIEALDYKEKTDEILVVGALADSESYSVDFPPEITGVTDGLIIRRDDETVNQSVLTSALKDYCNIDLSFLSGDRAKELKANAEVQNMPCWPAEGSVALVENTVVVKLSEN